MKRLRPARWSARVLGAPLGAQSCAVTARRPFCIQDSTSTLRSAPSSSSYCYSTAASAEPADASTATIVETTTTQAPLPSPPHHRARKSAKLAALHARLGLSSRIPLETLARALITASADPNPNFNNKNLAQLGSTIINFHVLEYLVCKWPRLPMAILYETQRAYAGPMPLAELASSWGVEPAAAPGEEVDPGLLQWNADQMEIAGRNVTGYLRAEVDRKEMFYRRGISSRVVLDNEFGDLAVNPEAHAAADHNTKEQQAEEMAHFSLVQSIIGAIYVHCGRESAKAFVESHILSRKVDISNLFAFHLPTRELAMLCAREGFEPPLARLESETGRRSRTPVFVVGIYSGTEKLGEGTAASLNFARRKASMNALRSWYLYSPGNKVRVPSDMLEEGAAPWKAPHIDLGEIV